MAEPQMLTGHKISPSHKHAAEPEVQEKASRWLVGYALKAG
jgi:hypothetical protein